MWNSSGESDDIVEGTIHDLSHAPSSEGRARGWSVDNEEQQHGLPAGASLPAAASREGGFLPSNRRSSLQETYGISTREEFIQSRRASVDNVAVGQFGRRNLPAPMTEARQLSPDTNSKDPDVYGYDDWDDVVIETSSRNDESTNRSGADVLHKSASWQQKGRAVINSDSCLSEGSLESEEGGDPEIDQTEHTEHTTGADYLTSGSVRDSRKWVAWLLWMFPCLPAPPTMNTLALGLAQYAPCFFCRGFKQRTDRALLERLNVLIAFFTTYQIGAAVFLLSVILLGIGYSSLTNESSIGYSFFSAAFWNMNGLMFLGGITCVVLFTAAVLTWRTIRDVNLVGIIRYLWVTM